MAETVIAAVVLLACSALLLRLLLPPARRQRLDQQLRHTWIRCRLRVNAVSSDWLQRRRTRREAHEVIERARRRSAGGGKVRRDGNVYRPDSFKPPTDRDTLH
jgi:hypothetical protein